MSRLIQPPNITHLVPLKGLWKREQRLYFLSSLACQPNPDRERAQRLLAIAMEARQRTDREDGLDPKGDSAGPKDIAQ